MIDADSCCLLECSPGGNCDDDGDDAKKRRGNSAPRIAPMLIAIAGHVTDCIVSVETASAFTVANATGTAPSTNVPSNVLPASTSARR